MPSDPRADPPGRRGGRRHRAGLLPRRGLDRRPFRPSSATKAPIVTPTSIFTISGPIEPLRSGRVPAHQSWHIGTPSGYARSSSRQGSRLLHAPSASMPGRLEKDLLEKYGEPCPEAMVESGRDHARILQDPTSTSFQDQREGVRRPVLAVAAYQQRRMPATTRGISASPRRARCGRGNREVVDWPGLASCGRDR